jgi:hypothetical protein
MKKHLQIRLNVASALNFKNFREKIKIWVGFGAIFTGNNTFVFNP